MSAEVKKEIELEIAHVLFIDIVGYSKLLINEQRRLLETLREIVRSSEQFRAAQAAERLIKIPTGDGMALVFYNSPEAPVECALEIARAMKEHPELKLRMGVHSGPVSGVIDVNEHVNVAGAGINIAQRVMGLRWTEQPLNASPIRQPDGPQLRMKDELARSGGQRAKSRRSSLVHQSVDRFPVGRSELDFGGGHVFLQMRERRCARNRQHDGRPLQKPS